jgi:hypothetical protein
MDAHRTADDPLRWETPDGESPSRFGALTGLAFAVLGYAVIAALAWAISRAIG